MTEGRRPRCKNLILDAGPLLSLSPLRGLAETYFTVPQVLAELKDSRAREHFERLGMMSGTKVEIQSPDAASLAHIIHWAKKTGDYSVLSHADLCVLALTYALHEEDRKPKEEESTKTAKDGEPEEINNQAQNQVEISPSGIEAEDITEVNTPSVVDDLIQAFEDSTLYRDSLEEVSETIQHVDREYLHECEEQNSELEVELATNYGETPIEPPGSLAVEASSEPIYDDPSDSDDGQGEWITPSNVALHKSLALDLLPDSGIDGKRRGKDEEPINSGCMTADFAVQNVLLQMGLNLVSLEGKRIEKVKTWVLRCHACFKICKDNSKKFCPSCGNNTLLRASVTISSPSASANASIMQVHLNPNFQYRVRGTKYPIPKPRPGSAKTGPGTALILREDQLEYMRAKKMAEGKREREETKLMKGILAKGTENGGANSGISSWMDPDWVPEILSVGSGGKGRTIRNSRMDGDLPQIGYGRKNPNEKKRRK